VVASVAAVTEELAADEANHELVLRVARVEVLGVLATRWRRSGNRLPSGVSALRRLSSPGEQILSVQNEQLRAPLWTGNRSLSAGTCVGLADAVRYERAGGDAIPGYSHVMAASQRLGPN
jgi:hypothetical protein